VVLVARVNRRAALQMGGAAAATALLAGHSHEVQADERGFSSSGKVTLEQRKVGKPPTPPLEVLVYSRLAFGHRPGDLDNFKRLPGSAQDKLKLWLESQLQPDKLEDTDCAKRVGKFDALDKPLTKSWREYWRDIPDENQQKYEIAARPTQQTRAATVTRMIWSKRQLLEVVVDFWHNHFNIHPDRDDNIRPIFADWDKNVIRKHAFGNFRQLLEATATHPAMLYYLDQASSNRGGPNENYARELFELHSMGAENYLGVKRQRDVPGYAEGKPVGYVDDDVYEATRCFTGWRVNDNKDEPGLRDDGTFAYYQPGHDRFQKTVLGRYFPPDQAPMKDGRDVLELLAAHPGTARYISRKLCRRLVADNPPQSLVDKAAKVFTEKRDAPDQIKHVLRAIVLSSEFTQTWGEKVKRPLETYVSLCRAFEAEFEVNDDRLWGTYWLGQAPFNHRPPDGYPDRREAWVSSTTLLRAWGFGLNLAHNWDENIKTPIMNANGNRRKPTEIAEFWINRLLGRPLHPVSLRDDLVAFLADGGDPNATIDDDDTMKWRVPMAAAFIATSPDFMTK
jgi:uncharacterized protein (DUF1800 family)